MNRNTKKGFTIVELIIVIAVIGILAAVLIPTFSGLIRNSQEAKDTALVRNLNVLLKMDNTKHESMRSVVEALDKQGADITKLTAAITENRILWDSEADLFAYLNKGTDGKETISYIPDFDGTPLETKYKYWIVSDSKADVAGNDYSVYWRGEGMDKLTVYTGFDCGKAKFGKIIYTSDKQQDVSLYINGGDLDVSAVNNGTQRLYGNVVNATIATGNDCLYVHGTIANATVTAGKVVADGGLVMVAAAESGVTVVGQNGGIVAKTADAGTLPDTVNVSTDAEKSAYALEIGTAAELASFRDMVNSGMTYEGLTVKLTADIDLSGEGNWTPIGQYKDENGNKISEQKFSGTFDGQSHTISGMSIVNRSGKSSYRALFGYTNGTIESLTVRGIVSGTDVAGVVAALGGKGIVRNVNSYVTINGQTGDKSQESEIKQGKAAGIILATKGEGSRLIENCKNYVSVSTTKDAASGIICWVDCADTIVRNCENSGYIFATGTASAAGIVGNCNTVLTIENCNNKGKIESANISGGIIASETTCAISVLNCTNSGIVVGKENDTGEIVGKGAGLIKNCKGVREKVLVGTLGYEGGASDNTIEYTSATTIELIANRVYGNLTLTNVAVRNVNVYQKTGNHTIALNSSTISELVITAENAKDYYRLFLTKTGNSSITKLNYTGSFNWQNSNSHGYAFIFTNGVVERANITNELIYNRTGGTSLTADDIVKISIVAKGTIDAAGTEDSNSDQLASIYKYNETTNTWEKNN